MLVLSMTSRSLAEPPEASTSLFGIIQLPLRWYPLVLIAFFSMLSMKPEVDLLVAWVFAVGVHQASGGTPLHPWVARLKLPLHRALPSSATAAAWEGSTPWGGGQQLGGRSACGCRAAAGKVF